MCSVDSPIHVANLPKAVSVYSVYSVLQSAPLRSAPLRRRCRDARSLLSLRCEQHVTKTAVPVSLQHPEMQGDATLFFSHTPPALARSQRIPAFSRERLAFRLRPALQLLCKMPKPAGDAGNGVLFPLELCRIHEQARCASCGMHHAWPLAVLVKGRRMLMEVACEEDSSLRALAASRLSLDL